MVEILADRGVAMASLELWDCPSNPVILEVMRDIYAEDVDGAVIVCDSTKPETFTAVKFWMQVFKNLDRKFPVILMANKVYRAKNPVPRNPALSKLLSCRGTA